MSLLEDQLRFEFGLPLLFGLLGGTEAGLINADYQEILAQHLRQEATGPPALFVESGLVEVQLGRVECSVAKA